MRAVGASKVKVGEDRCRLPENTMQQTCFTNAVLRGGIAPTQCQSIGATDIASRLFEDEAPNDVMDGTRWVWQGGCEEVGKRRKRKEEKKPRVQRMYTCNESYRAGPVLVRTPDVPSRYQDLPDWRECNMERRNST